MNLKRILIITLILVLLPFSIKLLGSKNSQQRAIDKPVQTELLTSK